MNYDDYTEDIMRKCILFLAEVLGKVEEEF
jgi:hypothetical protein